MYVRYVKIPYVRNVNMKILIGVKNATWQQGIKAGDIVTGNEEKKEYLKSYKRLCDKLKSLEEQLQALIEEEQSVKAISISNMPKGNKQKDLSDLIVKIEAVFVKIMQKRAECIKRKLEIESRIADMGNGIEADILRKKYLEFKTWEEICVELNYSWRQTHRLHSKALSNFKMA